MKAMLSRSWRQSHAVACAATLFGAFTAMSSAWAEPATGDAKPNTETKQAAGPAVAADSGSTAGSSSGSSGSSSSASKQKHPPYSDVLKEFKAVDGLIKLHHKDNQVYAELSSSQLNRDFIVLISIAKGNGEGQLLAGMTWGFGDDWLWQFRKVD